MDTELIHAIKMAVFSQLFNHYAIYYARTQWVTYLFGIVLRRLSLKTNPKSEVIFYIWTQRIAQSKLQTERFAVG